MALAPRTGKVEPSSMWWLARGEEHLPGDRSWLSWGEADYVDGKRFTKRRTEFLVARWTAKQALAQVLSTPLTLDWPAPHRGAARRERRAAGVPRRCSRSTCRSRSPTVPAGRSVSSAPGRAGWVATWNSSSHAATPSSTTTSPRPSGRYVDAAPEVAARDLAANLVWSAKESGLKVLTHGPAPRHPVGRGQPRTASVDAWIALDVRTAEGHAVPRLVAPVRRLHPDRCGRRKRSRADRRWRTRRCWPRRSPDAQLAAAADPAQECRRHPALERVDDVGPQVGCAG